LPHLVASCTAMSGTQAAKDEQMPHSLASSWFTSMFGQCCKGPPVEGELKFDDLERKEKKSSKKRDASKDPRESTSAGEACSPASAERTSARTSSYMVDNSVLQIEHRPGVAFRYTKREADKVKSERGPAKWGEIVQGIDEGDGWLKVGKYYLPMMYQGVPVVTPVSDVESSSEAKIVEGMPRAPATVTNPVRNTSMPHGSAQKLESGTPVKGIVPRKSDSAAVQSCLVANAAQTNMESKESTSGTEAIPQTVAHATAPTAEKVTVDEHHEPETCKLVDGSSISAISHSEAACANSDTNGQALSSGGDAAALEASYKGSSVYVAEVVEAQPACGETESKVSGSSDNECCKIRPAECMPDACPVEKLVAPSRAWFMQPSVGTWLQFPPEVSANDDQLLQAELDKAASPCEARPCERLNVNWYSLPSVGTWLHKAPGRRVSVEVFAEVGIDCEKMKWQGVQDLSMPQ